VVRRDLPEQVKGVHFVSLFLIGSRKVEGTLSMFDCLSPEASREARFAKPRQNARKVKVPQGRLLNGFPEQGKPCRTLAGEDVRGA
jgi:hypothetical protein